MELEKLNSECPYDFMDISTELYRVYVFPDKSEVRIDNPTNLAVSKSGHRLFDGKISHYIPFGWVHLYWQNQKGTPHFVK